jgi:hypothetical protein
LKALCISFTELTHGKAQWQRTGWRDDQSSRATQVHGVGGDGRFWTLAGGIPRPFNLMNAAVAASGFSFVQISDSHIGFDKPANPNVAGTLQEAVGKINALPVRPAFMIHTGDITHLSKPEEFEDVAFQSEEAGPAGDGVTGGVFGLLIMPGGQSSAAKSVRRPLISFFS